MMEPVLTQEELEAIYEAMKVDAVPAHAVDDFHLTAGQEFIKAIEQHWLTAAKIMAPRIESVLAGVLGQRIRIDILGVEIFKEPDAEESPLPTDGGEDLHVLPEDKSSVTQVVRLGAAPLLLGLDYMLARRYIERRTGVRAEGGEPAEERAELTLLEQRLLRDLILELGEAIASATKGPARVSLDNASPKEALDNYPKKEPWMILRFALQKMQGPRLCLRGPASVLSPVDGQLKESILNRLSSTRVTLSAELGKCEMKVAELWELKPGTLVPLEVTVGDPLRVLIGGVPKLLGEPLVSRGNIAIRITGRQKG